MMEAQTFVQKTWGWELWFANTARYCGKHLFVEKDKWSSNGKFHYHKLKDETFYIIDGSLRLEYESRHGAIVSIILNKGNSFRLMKDTRHRFTAVTDTGCQFIEASTTHRDTDSYRCSYDEETGEWVE